MDYIPPPPTLSPGACVFAYVRDSGGDSQEKSISQQESIIREYCNRHGLALVRVFADEARSGGNVEKRESFLAMIDATIPQEGRPAGILVWNLARFSRDVDDSDYYKSTLRRRGIVIHSLTDPIPAGHYAPVIEKLIDVANQDYRRQNAEAVRRSLQDLVRQGYAPGGHIPPKGYLAVKVTTGLKRDGKERTASRWEPDPVLAPLVQLAFKMRAEGKSYQEIAKATGLYKTPNCWNSFFKNRSYIGIGKCGDFEVEGHHPALVDRETFEAVQAFLRLHPRSGLDHPRRIAYPCLLSGLAYCAYCGGKIIYHAARYRTWPYYFCGRREAQKGLSDCQARRINARKLDAVILETVLKMILTPAYFEELLQETRQSLADTEGMDASIGKKQDDIKDAQKAMRNLLDLVEMFGAGAAEERYKKREAELTRLKFELQELEARREALAVEVTPEALAVVLAKWRQDIFEANQAGEVATARALLARFVNRIELDYTTARIIYTFPLDGFYPPDTSQALGGTIEIAF